MPTAALESDSPESEDLVCSCNNYADQVLILSLFVRFLKSISRPHDADRTRQVVRRSWEPTAASAVGTIWEELGKGPRIVIFPY